VTPLTRRVERAVARFVRERAVLRPGERVLAAVSGGPDSSALLLVLSALRPRLGIELVAAYFDHRLRGPEASAEERRAARAVAARAGVELVEGEGDVRAEARRGRQGIEAAARALRYRFLRDAAAAKGCGVVATGHTLDDQAETILLHVARGAGLRGLAGMAPRSPWPFGGDGPGVARPLLAVRRADTRAYCAEAGVETVEDPTNRLIDAARNRVRLEVLPALRALNPRIEEALVRLGVAAAEAEATLDTLAGQALGAARIESERISIPRAALQALPLSLRAHALVRAWQRLAASDEHPAERITQAMARAADGPAGSTLDLPRGVRLEVGYDAVVLRRGGREARAYPAEPVALEVPGEAVFGPWRLRAGPGPVPTDALTVDVDPSAAEGGLLVRTRRPGDRFQPAGMAQSKKLQDFFVDERVSRVERDFVPLVVSPRGIVWVVGRRLAEWARPRPAGATLRLAAWREPLRRPGRGARMVGGSEPSSPAEGGMA
jgi:tRNA(Ile)-lysidine synthase